MKWFSCFMLVAAMTLLPLFVLKSVRPISVIVRGCSMEPLLMDGDCIKVSPLKFRWQGAHPDDCVVFWHANKNRLLCKRCIAGPGDVISFEKGERDTTLYSNLPYAPRRGDNVILDSLTVLRYAHAISFETDKPLIWLDSAAYLGGHRQNQYCFTHDWYYMIGDNREHSLDSRHYGLIAGDMILGVVII